MSSAADITGTLRLRPGMAAPHNLHSSRQDWATRMGQGQSAQHLPHIMASLFNLCGQSHRVCSRMAIDAALGLTVEQTLSQSLSHETSYTLALETAREHVRRMGLDWPRAAGRSEAAQTLATQATDSLQLCPLFKVVEPISTSDTTTNAILTSSSHVWEATSDWLAQTCLNMPAHTWLAAWQDAPMAWLQTWSKQSKAWLPCLIAQAQSASGMDVAFMPADALLPHANLTDLRAWALTWADQPQFVLQPHWHGKLAHTGSWSRLHEVIRPENLLTPWLLLGYRLADLIRLCLTQGMVQTAVEAKGQVLANKEAQVLACGALQVGERQGLAWVEMARGLLMHQVTLDANDCVAQVQVLAPTSWNFHAEGVVASVLAQLPTQAQDLSWLMTAFDPCVPFEVCASTAEACHA
jgi:hypothetical protein